MADDPNRRQEIEEAFEWDQDYDKVWALAHLVWDKAEQLNLAEADLSEPEQVAVLVASFDAEIANGGFHQFFTNPIGDLWPEILHILETIRATQSAQLLIAALAVLPNSLPSQNREERFSALASRAGEIYARIALLDEGNYGQTEAIFTLAVECLRDHKAELL